MANASTNPNINDIYLANHLYTSDGIERNSLPLERKEAKAEEKGFYCEHTVNPTIYGNWSGKVDIKFCMREINQKEMLYGIYQQHVIQKENYGVIIYAYYGGGKNHSAKFH